MTIENQFIECYQGEDVEWPFQIFTDDTLTTPQDITGWSMQFTVETRSDRTVKLTKTTGAGIIIAAGTNGDCSVKPTAADTAAMDVDTYYFELARTDLGAHEVTNSGRLKVKPSRSFS